MICRFWGRFDGKKQAPCAIQSFGVSNTRQNCKSTCLLLSKQGPVDPASGFGTRERRPARGVVVSPAFFLKTCNKALNLYYEYNDKVFKQCYS